MKKRTILTTLAGGLVVARILSLVKRNSNEAIVVPPSLSEPEQVKYLNKIGLVTHVTPEVPKMRTISPDSARGKFRGTSVIQHLVENGEAELREIDCEILALEDKLRERKMHRLKVIAAVESQRQFENPCLEIPDSATFVS